MTNPVFLHFKYNNDLTNDPDQIFNTFCNLSTDVGPNYVNAIPAPKKQFTRYLKKGQKTQEVCL